MNAKWSESLSKSTISDFLIDDIVNRSSAEIPSKIIESLRIVVENKNDLKQLKKGISKLKPHISKDLYVEIQDEFKEIKEDLHWVGSKRGQYITKINDWIQPFHSEFNSFKEFEGVMIGGHSDKMVVFLTGKITDNKTYQKLINYVASKNPPFKVFTKIVITENEV